LKNTAKISLFFLLIGIICSSTILKFVLSNLDTNPEEDLLNPGTFTLFEKVDDRLIHCKDSRDIKECLDRNSDSKMKFSSLWLGNSQIHAINQYKKGQAGSPSILFNLLKRDSIDLITMSFGNANIQEHAVQFAYIIEQIKLKHVVIGLVFDDTREDGIREDVFKLILNSPETRKQIESFPIGQELINKEISSNQHENFENENDKNLQKKIEPILDDALKSISYVWELRNEIAYHYFVGLRSIRNYIFNITPSTVRKIIPESYKRNIESLEMMMQLASKNNIKMIPYIAPIRSDIKIPYIENEYSRFKNDVKEMSKRYDNVQFENLENIIDGDFWGLKNSTTLSEDLELDFMHFTAKGHEILADSLYKILHN